ncbi:MAG: DUF1801 domain-containing protein [Actinomycetota bacterium]
MSIEEKKDLTEFLQPFPENVRETVWRLRKFVWALYPDCNELIYDNYNALAIGFATSERAGDVFCSIAVYAKYVNFGFNRGTEIADPDKLLKGSGNLYRYLKVVDFNDFPATDLKQLLEVAHLNSLARLKEGQQILKGQTLTKSISPKKRRPV